MWKKIKRKVQGFLRGCELLHALKMLGLKGIPSSVKCVGAAIWSAFSTGSCVAAVCIGIGVVVLTMLGSLMHLAGF